MLTYKHRLPWVHNKKNKLYFKMKKDKKYKEKYKQLKHQVQKEQRHAYNTYIEKLILDLRAHQTRWSGRLLHLGFNKVAQFLSKSEDCSVFSSPYFFHQ